jgi:hypothetical protein
MRYLFIAILIASFASCAPSIKEMPAKEKVPAEHMHLEKRFKSESAVEKVKIAQTGAAFFYDAKLWAVKKTSDTAIIFEARRFSNAEILILDEPVPMTDMYKKIAQRHNMKDIKLLESEFINVNNAVVIFNTLEGVVNRRQVSILSYGFSDAGRTVIAHCFIYKGMLRDETRHEIIEFLNGLTPKG